MRRFLLAAGLAATALGASGADASYAQQRHPEQEAATQQRQMGRLLPLREIERRVVAQMRGAEYLGFDFDAETAIYTLKFVRNGSVIWVDVDGRSGQIVRQSGK